MAIPINCDIMQKQMRTCPVGLQTFRPCVVIPLVQSYYTTGFGSGHFIVKSDFSIRWSKSKLKFYAFVYEVHPNRVLQTHQDTLRVVIQTCYRSIRFWTSKTAIVWPALSWLRTVRRKLYVIWHYITKCSVLNYVIRPTKKRSSVFVFLCEHQ